MKARQDEGKCFQGVDIQMDVEPVLSAVCHGPTKAGVLGQNIMSYWFAPSSAKITAQQGRRARCVTSRTQQTPYTRRCERASDRHSARLRPVLCLAEQQRTSSALVI